MVSEKSFKEVLEWAINSLKVGDVAFVTYENEKIKLRSCLEIIYGSLDVLKENDGYEEWEIIKSRFRDEIEANVSDHIDQKFSGWGEVIDLCLVFMSEIFRIKGDSEINDFLSKLLSARENYFVKNKDKKLMDYFGKYEYRLRSNLEMHRKAQASESMINKEIDKRLESYESREKYLNEQLTELKSNFSALKGDASFLSSSKVFNRLEDNARAKEKRALLAAFLFAFFTIAYLFTVAIYLIDNAEFSFFQVNDGSYGGLMFWEEIRLLDIKLLMISSTFVFLGIYFFRVFLSIYQRNNKWLQELELKSAISFYIEGHAKFVKESGGDCGESIAKYEDFIFGNRELKENDVRNPKPTDSLKEVGEVAEKLVKAGMSKR